MNARAHKFNGHIGKYYAYNVALKAYGCCSWSFLQFTKLLDSQKTRVARQKVKRAKKFHHYKSYIRTIYADTTKHVACKHGPTPQS